MPNRTVQNNPIPQPWKLLNVVSVKLQAIPYPRRDPHKATSNLASTADETIPTTLKPNSPKPKPH